VLSTDNPFYRQVVLLVELLPLIARESCFALKGGTAINLFIRDLPRLSVDIDLTYIPIQDRGRSLAHIDESLRRLGTAIETTLRGAKSLYVGRSGELTTKFHADHWRNCGWREHGPRTRLRLPLQCTDSRDLRCGPVSRTAHRTGGSAFVLRI
jgi:hypothetical protein